MMLPPTSDRLLDEQARPYFIWWQDLTIGDFKRLLVQGKPHERAYWLAALLREANTRDVWLFTTPAEVRSLWPHLVRHLGQARARWAWLLDLEDVGWPPYEPAELPWLARGSGTEYLGISTCSCTSGVRTGTS